MNAALLLAALLTVVGCASVAPPRPRFVAVHEQRTALCRIDVLLDTRSSACFLAFQCRRQVQVIAVEPAVCVP